MIRLPCRGGVGLKPEHFEAAAAVDTAGMWFEVHPENYMMGAGPRLAGLAHFAADHPISFHGVGASLGGPEPVSERHLGALKYLIDRFDPVSVSEHATWSVARGHYFAELLPLPRTKVAQQQLVDGIDRFQNAIGRSILIENPSNYLTLRSEMDEPEFLIEAATRAGCGLLLDVNNVFVSAHNCGIDPWEYIRAIPPELVGEVHVAGFSADENPASSMLIDSHGAAVADEVWDLLDYTLSLMGPVPVLIERDSNLPRFAELMDEVLFANQLIARHAGGRSASHA